MVIQIRLKAICIPLKCFIVACRASTSRSTSNHSHYLLKKFLHFSPTILFFDQFDIVGSKRNTTSMKKLVSIVTHLPPKPLGEVTTPPSVVVPKYDHLLIWHDIVPTIESMLHNKRNNHKWLLRNWSLNNDLMSLWRSRQQSPHCGDHDNKVLPDKHDLICTYLEPWKVENKHLTTNVNPKIDSRLSKNTTPKSRT